MIWVFGCSRLWDVMGSLVPKRLRTSVASVEATEPGVEQSVASTMNKLMLEVNVSKILDFI